MYKNLVIINQSKPADTQIAVELLHMLDKSAYYNGDYSWSSSPQKTDESAFLMGLDSGIYTINNFVKSHLFNNIVYCWYFPKRTYIENMLVHLKPEDFNITIVYLQDSSRMNEEIDEENRLKNVEYFRDNVNNNLVKLINYDIAELSPVMAAHYIYRQLNTI